MPKRLWLLLVIAVVSATAGASEPLFPISVRDKHGFINRAGTVVVPPEYDVADYADGIIRIRRGARTAYLDAHGTRLIAPQEEMTEPFAEGLTPARGRTAEGKYLTGYKNRTGNWAIAPRFGHGLNFSEGHAQVAMADE